MVTESYSLALKGNFCSKSPCTFEVHCSFCLSISEEKSNPTEGTYEYPPQPKSKFFTPIRKRNSLKIKFLFSRSIFLSHMNASAFQKALSSSGQPLAQDIF